MKFHLDNDPPPYLNRKDQFRLMALVGLLVLIVLSIDFTRKAENWAWFFTLGQQTEEPELKELNLEDLDFRVKQTPEVALEPDEFLAVASDDTPVDITELGFDIGQIPRELLIGVEDRHVGLLRSEQPAMDLALKRVRTLSETELQSAAADNVGFRVIFTDPERYRGKLFKLEGTLWQFRRFPFGDPSATDDDLWQAWLLSSDSGNNPWLVLLAEKPAGIETGNEINREVSLVGYFFKNYGYATDVDLHLAPLLIARTLHLEPMPVVQNDTQDLSLYVMGCLLTMGLFFGLLIWYYRRGDRRFEQSHLAEIAESRLDAPPEAIENLNKLEAHAPEEFFTQLSDASKPNDT